MNKIPYWFLCFFVFSLPWQAHIIIPGLGTVSRLLGFMLVGIGVLYILFKKNLKEPPLFLIIGCAFVFWGLLSYIWSVNQGATIGRFIQNIQFLAMMWLIWEICDSKKDYRILMQLFVIGLFIPVYEMLSMFISDAFGYYRISAGEFGANRMGLYLSLGIPIAWYLYITQKQNIYNLINLIYIPLAIFCVVLTGSRMGLVATVIGMLIVPLTFFNLKTNSKIIVASFSIVCILISLMYYSEIAERLERNIERLSETHERIQASDYPGRNIIWQAGMLKIPERPFQGFGAGTSRFVLGKELHRDQRSAHNTYIAILLDVGIIGIVMMLSIVLIAIIPALSMSYIVRIFTLISIMIIFAVMIVYNLDIEKSLWFMISMYGGHAYIMLRDGHFSILKRN